MMNHFKQHYPLISTVLFIVIILLAHIVASEKYQPVKHTISHLGAQNYSHSWIMQVGFLLFGLIVSLGVVFNGVEIRTSAILIYGICIAFTGIFCTEPFIELSSYSIQQANLHSLFAQVAGISFSCGILIQLFYTQNQKLKVIHFSFFILVIGLSALFGLFKNQQGIVQRLLYIVSLYWFSFWFQPQ